MVTPPFDPIRVGGQGDMGLIRIKRAMCGPYRFPSPNGILLSFSAMRSGAQNLSCCITTLAGTEVMNMSITQRCNYAGPHGNRIPTRSFAFSLFARFTALVHALHRSRV